MSHRYLTSLHAVVGAVDQFLRSLWLPTVRRQWNRHYWIRHLFENCAVVEAGRQYHCCYHLTIRCHLIRYRGPWMVVVIRLRRHRLIYKQISTALSGQFGRVRFIWHSLCRVCHLEVIRLQSVAWDGSGVSNMVLRLGKDRT